ncbi:MAG TPA: L-threonylcarbamoyladenylate synthase, partial [Longimicrobium sp.]|nr:L-threonylcarbamoyladenylate synthase [Longimicrobium sp.]
RERAGRRRRRTPRVTRPAGSLSCSPSMADRPNARVLPADPAHVEAYAAAIAEGAARLRAGGLVAFPTETVYGLGANALDAAAVRAIYAAKGRPSYNPLIVHVPSPEAARGLARAWPDAAERLARAFWPGPLTLVVEKDDAVPDAATAGLSSVALRVPAHPVALALLETAAIPVAAPSANRSTQVSPTTAEHVRRSLGDRVDLVLDGGACPVGIESTVVSLAGEVPTVLRPGTISIDQLRAVVGEVETASAQPSGRAARPSPGMLDRHYAPKAEVRLFDPRSPSADALAWTSDDDGRHAVLVVSDLPHPPGDVVRMPADAGEYAARLYSTLHALDEEGYAVVWVERVSDAPAWDGVRDRLRRAATPG